MSRWQCQRLAQHEGPHEASYSEKSRSHLSWKDEDSRIDYETLPGTVRFRLPFWTAKRRGRITEWAVALVPTAIMWWLTSTAMTVVYLCLVLLMSYLGALLIRSVERSRLLDFGRFTVGVQRTPRTGKVPVVGLDWVRYDGTGRKSGVGLVIGRVSVCMFALMPRKEWAARQCDKAKEPGGSAGR
ncbi:hypothetical protein ACIP93_33740 [Streptomyces sp. NPDC088745]|uniref:hypothetical protein n=1 Tax=Streptomyces sp. NPDC088745 TaxID=3365884 RepID=UPI00380A4C8F